MKKFTKKLALALMMSMLFMTASCTDAAKEDFDNAASAAESENEENSTDEEAEPADSDSETMEAGEDGLLTNGTLIMGTNASFPPFEYLEGGEIVGFDVDVMAEVAKDLNLDLEIKDIEFDSLPTALSQGQIDVIAAGLTARPDREETMDFSESYYNAVQTVIVRKDSGYTSVDDVKDGILGVQAGTTGNFLAEEYTDVSNVKGFGNGMLAVEALRNKSVDAVIIDNNPAKVYFDQYPDELELLTDQFDPEDYVFAVKKGNRALLTKIDEALAAMREDGRFDEIKSRYLSE